MRDWYVLSSKKHIYILLRVNNVLTEKELQWDHFRPRSSAGKGDAWG